jgi:hypothetical protein
MLRASVDWKKAHAISSPAFAGGPRSVLRMAHENASWGYKRIEGALHNLGYAICSSTVANILRQYGVEPAPSRQRTISWAAFLKAHWDAFHGLDLDGISLWLIEWLKCFFGQIPHSESTSRAGVEASQTVTRQIPNSIYLRVLDVTDKEFRRTRAPPSSVGKIPSLSARDIRSAA